MSLSVTLLMLPLPYLTTWCCGQKVTNHKHRMPGDADAGALSLPEQREKAGEMGMKQEEPWTDACAAASFKMLQIDHA